MTEYVFAVASGDACLDGHFPGMPIVPGVVLLDHLGRAAARAYGVRPTRIVRCKFVAALEPDQACTIGLEAVSPDRLRFTCTGPGGCVAHGLVECRRGDDG